MRKIFFRVLGLNILLIASCSSQLYAATQHIVERNETLSGIARHYGVSQTAIINANGLKVLELKVNDILHIPDREDSSQYIVKPGDSLTRVAQKYNIEVSQLAQMNNIPSNSLLNIGQRLTVPQLSTTNMSNSRTTTASTKTKSSSRSEQNTNSNITPKVNTPRESSGQKYKVAYGDNLSKIARQYGISTQQLAQANNMRINDTLYFGQWLTIPTDNQICRCVPSPANKPAVHTSSASRAPSIYTVKSGDSLIKLAQRYNINVKELADLNNINHYDYLFIGQRLKIPASASTQRIEIVNSNNENY
ncbi:muramidase family protein [Psychrobacter sp. I-STPA6b]|uniref:muramidase family protein n=1 Tax=Psychrobacter sp. I-STPA6b TaxID=2585718 RepID=UPI001D0CD2E2|nr:LysM peptidoglycan-binding domain-containing protein [Psychrobacter sp. I-STPA6b]